MFFLNFFVIDRDFLLIILIYINIYDYFYLLQSRINIYKVEYVFNFSCVLKCFYINILNINGMILIYEIINAFLFIYIKVRNVK